MRAFASPDEFSAIHKHLEPFEKIAALCDGPGDAVASRFGGEPRFDFIVRVARFPELYAGGQGQPLVDCIQVERLLEADGIGARCSGRLRDVRYFVAELELQVVNGAKVFAQT